MKRIKSARLRPMHRPPDVNISKKLSDVKKRKKRIMSMQRKKNMFLADK